LLLAIDVGNTNSVIGLFDGDSLIKKFRVATNVLETFDEISLKVVGLLKENDIKIKDVGEVIISSVVPQVTGNYIELSEKLIGVTPLVVGPGVKSGIEILYENPREVGADRIANAVGGYKLFGGPLIVVDLGTAITFDAISVKGDYMGGVISPGIATSMAELSQKAAQLPQVSLTRPRKVIGKNTIESMQSGAVFGFAGMIDSIVRKVAGEMEGEPEVVATGGDCQWLKKLSATIDHYEPDLTLYGLLYINKLRK